MFIKIRHRQNRGIGKRLARIRGVRARITIIRVLIAGVVSLG